MVALVPLSKAPSGGLVERSRPDVDAVGGVLERLARGRLAEQAAYQAVHGGPRGDRTHNPRIRSSQETLF